MIVFSGPTTGPSRTGIEWSNLGNPAEEPVWIIKYGNPDRSMQPVEELSKQKHVNLSDLANITVDVLCPLQLIYQNLTDDEWVWELSNVNISDIVTAIKLDGYAALSDVIVLPVWYKVVMTLLFIVCLIWACFSNLRVLVTIGTRKSPQSSMNILIGALAVSDLLTVCCATPTEVSFILHDLYIWAFGTVGCVIFPYLQSAAVLSNAFILCLIAYDRYICVVKMQPQTFTKRPDCYVITAIALVWLISMGVSLPAFWLWRVYYYILVDDVPDPEIGIDFCSVFPSCVDNKMLPIFFHVYHAALCGLIFIPLFIFFVAFYIRIGHFLWIRSPVGSGDDACNLHLTRKKRIVKALFWLVFWFFFCRMPNWIYVMVTMFHPQEATAAMLMTKSLLVFLSVFNTVVNPRLYYQLDEPLRKMINDCTDSFNCCSNLMKFCCHYRSSTCNRHECLHRRQHEQNLDESSQQQSERRASRNQVEPIGTTQEDGIMFSPNNDAAIFTVTQVAQSTSRNGKTRQTYTH